MNRAFSKILILVILVILAGVGVFAWQYFGAPAGKTPKDETVSWKVYTNEEGGYLFKYPNEWNAVTNKYNPKNSLFGLGATSESGYGGVEYIGTLSSGQSLKDFVKEFNGRVELGSISETEAIINNQNVIISILPKAGIEPKEAKNVSFEKDGKVFNMYLMYYTDFVKYPEDKQRLNIFNQMLSTFRFLGKSLEKSIKILSPNGGEKWIIGNTYQITWSQKGLEGEKVLISLADFEADGTSIQGSYYIATELSSEKESYLWMIPLDFSEYYKFYPEGTDISKFKYKISITTKGGASSDMSNDYFSIAEYGETADWKIYRNEGYGFEIKYPATFNSTELTLIFKQHIPPHGTDLLINNKVSVSDGDIIPLSLSFNVFPTTIDDLEKYVKDKIANSTAFHEKWNKEHLSDPIKFNFTYSEIAMGEAVGYAMRSEFPDSGQDNTEIFTQNSKNLIRILYDSSNNERVEVIQKILSTFRFLE